MYTYGITGTSIDEFRDVTLAAISNGQVLVYNSTTSQWVNVDPSTLNISLDNLSDVTITSLADNELLQYDVATGLWQNTAVSSLGISLGDVSGNYVADVDDGTGISVTHTPGAGSTATVALDADLDDLNDVTAPSPSVGDFLKWNGTAWVNDVVSLTADLDDLGDVVVTSASIGQVLEHNGTNFVNRINRAPQYGLQTAVTTRKYSVVNGTMSPLAGINVGSAATIVFKNACSVTDLSIHLNATYSAPNTFAYRLGIYADSNGVPGALLIDGGTVSIAQNATPGFKTINLASAVAVAANTPIWLVCAATHGPGAVPTLTSYVGNHQPYSDFGLSGAIHFQAACLGYTTAPGTVFPATFSLTSPETQPGGVAVWATVTVP